jgi:hypothetical protein
MRKGWIDAGIAIALLVGAAVACKKGETSTSTGASTAPTTGGPTAPASEEYLTIPNTAVQIKPPPGWNRQQRGEWGLLGSPDKKALLAFVNFDRPNESTARLGQVATILGTSDIKWGSAKAMTIGPDAMPAQAADGTCRFPSGSGIISYATVNPGGSQQILVVYAVNDDAPAESRQAAIATVASLRKKR